MWANWRLTFLWYSPGWWDSSVGKIATKPGGSSLILRTYHVGRELTSISWPLTSTYRARHMPTYMCTHARARTHTLLYNVKRIHILKRNLQYRIIIIGVFFIMLYQNFVCVFCGFFWWLVGFIFQARSHTNPSWPVTPILLPPTFSTGTSGQAITPSSQNNSCLGEKACYTWLTTVYIAQSTS